MNILVLGVYTDDCEPFGGIVNLEKLTNSEDDKDLYKGIVKALNEKNDLYGGAAFRYGYGNTTKWEKMPFTGTIDAEVCLYVD